MENAILDEHLPDRALASGAVPGPTSLRGQLWILTGLGGRPASIPVWPGTQSFRPRLTFTRCLWQVVGFWLYLSPLVSFLLIDLIRFYRFPWLHFLVKCTCSESRLWNVIYHFIHFKVCCILKILYPSLSLRCSYIFKFSHIHSCTLVFPPVVFICVSFFWLFTVAEVYQFSCFHYRE